MSIKSHHMEQLYINGKTIPWLTALKDVEGGGVKIIIQDRHFDNGNQCQLCLITWKGYSSITKLFHG